MTSAPSEPRSDRARPPVPGRSAAGRSASGRARTRIRVLVADDDERSLDCLVALLDREGFSIDPPHGFSIDPAHGGLEALARLGLLEREGDLDAPAAPSSELAGASREIPVPYDFMVLDYNMPDLTGVEVMRRVRVRLGGALPAIMVSGDYSHELMRSWNAVGGFSLLPKPVEPADFRTQVNLLIQRFFGGAHE